MNEQSLNGRVALVSGGARGQGASHARYLAGQGASVVIGDVLTEECEATASALRAEGLKVEAVELDVRDSSQWNRAVETAVERFGRLDILVNNAGMMTPGDVMEETEENWDLVVGVNLKGQWLGIRAAVPALKDAGGGSIINIASTFGVRPPPHGVAYAAAKGGVRTMTRNVAMALAEDQIRVNAIVIPMVDTPFIDPAKERGTVEVQVKNYPMGRIATPDDVSPVVVFLASSASGFMTGSEVTVDGGVLAGTTFRL